jgi:hypothetical protein
MKKKSQLAMNVLIFSLAVISVFISACGGGGGDSSSSGSRTATLKLSTSGTPSAPFYMVSVTVILPVGVTPMLNGDGTVAASVTTPSGVAATSAVATTPLYVPASGGVRGMLRITVLANSAAGYGVGEYVTLVLKVADGANPSQSDFNFSGFTVTGYSSPTGITGLTPAMTGFNIQ